MTLSDAVAGRGWLDRLAIGLSTLCVVHCLGTAIAVALLSSVGGILVHHAVHEIGLVLAIGLAALSLSRGIAVHGFMLPGAIGGLGIGVMSGALTMHHGGEETMFTILGVAIVALGHDLNRRALI